MSEFRIPFGSAVETAIDWLIRTLGWFFNFIRTILQGAYKGLEDLLLSAPFWAVIVVVILLGVARDGEDFVALVRLGEGHALRG